MGVPEDAGSCVSLESSTEQTFCYPPKDVIYEFKAAGEEMPLVCVKGLEVKYEHQVFWWYFIKSIAANTIRDLVIAAAAGIATTSNWRRLVALAHCRCVLTLHLQ